MAFVKLMGITVPVLEEGGAEITLVNQGEYGRAFSGTPYSAVRATSEDYRGRWQLVARRTSTAYSLLVRGAGHGFRFATAGSGASADYYSSKGLAPAVVTGTPTTYATGGPVSNKGYLKIPTGGSLEYTLPTSPLTETTLSFWAADDPMGTWTHYVYEHSGPGATPAAQWENGAVAGSFISQVTLNIATSGVITLTLDGTAVEWYFAELVVLPYRATLLESTWYSWAYNGGSGRRAESLAYLTMEGDWARTGVDTVLGEVLAEQQRTVNNGGSVEAWGSGSFRLMSTGTAS